jgi:hypothetical protein
MDTVVASIVCSAAEATYAEAGPDSTLQPNETQQEHGCQYQSTYSNNTDNQDTHRLSAVSNRAAADHGESGPCGDHSADMEPTATGRMGLRGTTFAAAAPTPFATTDVDVGSGRSGVQDSARRTQFDSYYTNNHEVTGRHPVVALYTPLVSVTTRIITTLGTLLPPITLVGREIILVGREIMMQ